MKHYFDVISDLKNAKYVPLDGTAIYDFYDLPLEDVFERFFEFGQEHLERTDHPVDIGPAVLFYNTGMSINAAAIVQKDLKIIEIYKGALFWIHNYFYELEANIIEDAFPGLAAIIARKGISPSFFLFQVCSLYFFYHEFAHLLQGQNGQLEAEYVEFISNANLTEAEIKVRHMRELDADWFSVQTLPVHILSYWPDTTSIPEDELISLVSFALSSIFLYHIKVSERAPSLYYEEHTHPHPSVRLAYNVTFFLEGAAANVKINQEAVLKRTIDYCIKLLKTERNIVEEYSVELYTHLDEIEKYVKQIITNTENYPSLTVRKIKINGEPK